MLLHLDHCNGPLPASMLGEHPNASFKPRRMPPLLLGHLSDFQLNGVPRGPFTKKASQGHAYVECRDDGSAWKLVPRVPKERNRAYYQHWTLRKDGLDSGWS